LIRFSGEDPGFILSVRNGQDPNAKKAVQYSSEV
jgi:hypothetical protein